MEEEESELSPDKNEVNSKAVVLYEGELEHPASIKWLGPDLDLKIPPQNWMRARSPLERYVQRTLCTEQRRSHMSSISMASSNIDMVNYADVISDAKNIKSLLGVKFSDKPISLMVHRVGKSLLIDEFDIHKYLLRKQKDEWAWLRKFIQKVMTESEKPSRSQQRLTDKNIFSKFLYHSINDMSDELNKLQLKSPEDEPSSSEPEPDGNEFCRMLEWSFEDIKMMIGTDLPVFQVGSSVVSLRLRDINEPITVLTGLEYWLDNLMCNVPEVAMCYHQQGFVRKYERIKTTSLPALEGAEFKPEYVRDVAQDILSFLKSNATKFGHTYWLYKGKNDDYIKLYDLTSLCENDEETKQDPFRIPLAMLLIKVAAKLHKRQSSKKSGMILALLSNSLVLLQDDKPKETAAANLIISDLYLSEDGDYQSCDIPGFPVDVASNDVDEDNIADCEGSEDDEGLDVHEAEKVNIDSLCKQLSVTHIAQTFDRENKAKGKFPPITGKLETRCTLAIKHIAQGLSAIDTDVDLMNSKDSSSYNKDHLHSCNPAVAIPLPYQSLSGEGGHNFSEIGSIREARNELILKRQRFYTDSWHGQSKSRLLRKARFAFYKLAESYNTQMEYGMALKFVRLALLCNDVILKLDSPECSKTQELCSLLYKLCGDVQLRLAAVKSDIESYKKDYEELSDSELTILNSCQQDILSSSNVNLYRFWDDVEQRLLSGYRSYKLSLELTEDRELSTEDTLVLYRRLGNCCNELGRYYMDKASQLYTKNTDENEQTQAEIEASLSASEPYITDGIEYFKKVSDRNNTALLISNSARLLRIKAQVMVRKDRVEFTAEERTLYNQAAERYLQALSTLSKSDNCVAVRDMISFELSGVYCTIASLLQDYTPISTLSREQVERDVTDLMLKALKYCDSASSSDVMRQYRAATIHHRLSSLFHNSYRDYQGISEQKAKHLRQMTESHYSKAANLFLLLESHSELLRVLLERVALCEFDFNNHSSVASKFKYLETALDIITGVEIRQCLSAIANSTDHIPSTDQVELLKLMNILISRLQFVTLNLVKLSSASEKKSLNRQFHQDLFMGLSKHKLLDTTIINRSKQANTKMHQQQMFKEMYKKALELEKVPKISVTSLSCAILKVLADIKELSVT